MNNRINFRCKEKRLINKNQTGFKEKHRTSDNLLTLKNVVKKYVTIGKGKLYTCFVDFKKAYDSVWHKGLFFKMRKNNLSGKLLDLIIDIYKKTKCSVKVKDSCTDFFEYTRGVRQGCPLSPILFNIYVSDLFKIINENNETDICLNGNDPINALMYVDDLVLLSDIKEGLQKQIDKLSKYCEQWKLNINLKKTKIMIFNRGNTIIKSEFTINNVMIENVKSIKYLGFTITAKNCSFMPTLEDLSIKARRVVYALNTKIKISRLPINLTIKLFNSLIKPILLYGSEVWGSYTDFDYANWDRSNIEMTHTQFLKRALGCNVRTSNIMVRGEIGGRPLLLDIIIKTMTYINNIKERPQAIVYSALDYESNNEIAPNFSKYIDKFNLMNSQEILNKTKANMKIICQNNYDRYWLLKLGESPKAISYTKIKPNVYLEKYLHEVKNIRHKIALSRLRLSNHNLLIETGRHIRPKLDRENRKCFICKDDIEDEMHFITKCPLYSSEREELYKSLKINSKTFESLSRDQKFIFILTNEDKNVMTELAKYTYRAMKVREKAIEGKNN